jgi:uroporphyrinogen decarboxylase
VDLFINEKNKINIYKAMKGEKVDSAPVYFSDQLDFLSGWLNLECDRYHFDAEIMLLAQNSFNKRFGGCGILGPNFGVSLEASAFGAEIKLTKKTPPWVKHLCSDFDRMIDFIDNLKEPDPLSAGYLPLFYQTYFYMQKLSGHKLGAPLGVIAVIDVAALLVGFDNICLLMKINPEYAHIFFRKINRFLIRFIETKIRLFNIQKIEMIDQYGDYAGYLSRDEFKEFVSPYVREIFDHFKEDESTVCLYHCDGNLNHLIDLIPETGCNCLYDFDPSTDIGEFVQKIGDRVSLVGNIKPIEVMRNCTPESVYYECKKIIEKGKNARGFILANGGELANGTPPENIDAALNAVRDFGVY